MSSVPQPVSNYLVPATGSPNMYAVHETFSAAPFIVDFSQISLNGLAFRPSGVIIDNTAGTGDLDVLIPQASFNVICKAGATLMMPYPALQNHTASITGLGDATVIFVDFPLMPYSSAQAAGIVIPNPLPISASTPIQIESAPLTNNPVLIDAFLGDLNVQVNRGNPVGVTITIASGMGSTINFARGLYFENIGTTAVIVAGASIPAGTRIVIPNGSVIAISSVSYDATGGSLMIVECA